ncbi:hypothetical protein GSI_05519 [Ganoderma sinense ZZ0214-1]|uniref:Uncharacterized protein n=1 Tax=Ganoderma sinense ZZ0214-1 TaxID=1077348 RepID=A0A2G8SES2_9APHY|nr:hypothetical protein GSI_05519 [Ganoderma sinense ZZ0214-1]
MEGKKAYGCTNGGEYHGDFSSQQKTMDASMNAADGLNRVDWHTGGPERTLAVQGSDDSASAFLLKEGQVATVIRFTAASNLSLNTPALGDVFDVQISGGGAVAPGGVGERRFSADEYHFGSVR